MTTPAPEDDDAAAAEGDPVHGPRDAAPRRSGLRNPEAAVRGLGAGTLALEAIVLLLAIQPIRMLGGDLSGWGDRRGGRAGGAGGRCRGQHEAALGLDAGTVLQVLLLASGLLHWSLAALGLIFGAAWAYATYVRKTILG